MNLLRTLLIFASAIWASLAADYADEGNWDQGGKDTYYGSYDDSMGDYFDKGGGGGLAGAAAAGGGALDEDRVRRLPRLVPRRQDPLAACGEHAEEETLQGARGVRPTLPGAGGCVAGIQQGELQDHTCDGELPHRTEKRRPRRDRHRPLLHGRYRR